MSATARPGPLNRAIRRFNRTVYNPLAMTVAGLRHSPYSVVKHIGRKSGRPYETPVIAHAVGDGFIIALPYGDDVDWCRNILVAGRCTITRGGVEHRVDAPQILDPSRALPELPRALPVAFRLFGLNARKMSFLRLRRLTAS